MGAYREPREPENQAPPPLRFELRAPGQVRARDSVPVTLVVRNTGTDTIRFSTGDDATTFTVVVTTPDGREVWERLRYQLMDLIEVRRTLGPGDELRLRTAWPQTDNGGRPAPPGTYHLRGVLFVGRGPNWTTARAPVVVSGR